MTPLSILNKTSVPAPRTPEALVPTSPSTWPVQKLADQHHHQRIPFSPILVSPRTPEHLRGGPAQSSGSGPCDSKPKPKPSKAPTLRLGLFNNKKRMTPPSPPSLAVRPPSPKTPIEVLSQARQPQLLGSHQHTMMQPQPFMQQQPAYQVYQPAMSMFGASPYVFSGNYYLHQPQMQPSFGYQPLQPPMQVGGGPFTFGVGQGCMLQQQQHPGGI